MKSNLSYVYNIVAFLFRFLLRCVLRGKVYGAENVPSQGAFLIASNHVSHSDPPLIACNCPRQPVFSVARSTLFTKWSRWLYNRLHMLPIDREKGADLKAIKAILQKLQSGQPVLMFPEGTRSLTGIPQRAKKGVGMIAARAQVPVLPVHIFGTYDVLPKGRHWPSFKNRVFIVFGKPLYPQDFEIYRTEPDVYQAMSDRIMQAIAQIKRPTKKVNIDSAEATTEAERNTLAKE